MPKRADIVQEGGAPPRLAFPTKPLVRGVREDLDAQRRGSDDQREGSLAAAGNFKSRIARQSVEASPTVRHTLPIQLSCREHGSAAIFHRQSPI